MSGQLVTPTTAFGRMQRGHGTFQNAASFTAPAPSASAPATALFVKNKRNQLAFTPIGIGSDGQTVQALIVGWYHNSDDDVYVPIELLRVTGTMGSQTLSVDGDTWRFCDTLVQASGEGLEGTNLVIQCEVSQGGVAHILMDLPGCEYVQALAIKGTATSADVLILSY